MRGGPQRGARQYRRSTASAERGHNKADGPRSSFRDGFYWPWSVVRPIAHCGTNPQWFEQYCTRSRCSQATRPRKPSCAQRDKPSFIACHGSRGASATRGGALRGAEVTGSALDAGGDSAGALFAASALRAALRAPALGAVFIGATRASVSASGGTTSAPVAGRFCGESRGDAMAGVASRATIDEAAPPAASSTALTASAA